MNRVNTVTDTQHLTDVMRTSDEAMIALGVDGRIIAWNPRAETMFGYDETAALKMNIYDLVPATKQAEMRRFIQQVSNGDIINSFETQHLTADGHPLDVCLCASPLANDNGEVIAIAAIEHDLADDKNIKKLLVLNKQLEKRISDYTSEKSSRIEKLEKYEQQLQAILNTAPDAIITINQTGIINSFNPAAEKMFGYTSTDVLGKNVKVLTPAPYREKHDDYIANYLKTRAPKVIGNPREVRGRRKNGSEFPMELNVTEVDHLGLFIGITRDLSKQRTLEKEIIRVSSIEQERIGHEIHDGLGQHLTALSMLASSLANKFAKQGLAEAASLKELADHLKQAVKEARMLSHVLAPVPITPEGLEDALNKLAEQVRISTGISCKLKVKHPALVDDRTVSMELYRIIQEAVNNAVKHANATNITIALSTQDHGIDVMVADDGAGIEPVNEESEGIGLHIMRYRANIIGATLQIQSAPDQGTVVRCSLPVTSGA